LLNNENSENEKRTHKIVCSIIGSFPIKGYILDEPEVSGLISMMKKENQHGQK
jgi:hypothetical protein